MPTRSWATCTSISLYRARSLSYSIAFTPCMRYHEVSDTDGSLQQNRLSILYNAQPRFLQAGPERTSRAVFPRSAFASFLDGTNRRGSGRRRGPVLSQPDLIGCDIVSDTSHHCAHLECAIPVKSSKNQTRITSFVAEKPHIVLFRKVVLECVGRPIRSTREKVSPTKRVYFLAQGGLLAYSCVRA